MSKHRQRPDRENGSHGRVLPEMGFETGAVAGSTTAKRLPDIPCEAAKIKAARSNLTNVYVGGQNVRIVGTVDQRAVGFELDAGEETPWYFVANLEELYIICDAAGDDITYTLLT